MKLLKYAFSISILFLLYACPDVDELDYNYKIKNLSNEDIYYYGSETLDYFPPFLNETFIIPSGGEAPSGTNFKYGKVYIWFFDKDIIENTPFSEVIENEMYLEKHELTLNDLKAMNWEIIYTGE